MFSFFRSILLVPVVVGMFIGSPVLHAQATVNSITKQIQNLRSVSTDKRPEVTKQIALDIRTLPPGLPKLKLAVALKHLSTEGDPGHETLQAVGDTLAKSLAETPQPVGKNGLPQMPYMDLAELVRYEGVTTDFNDPLYQQAQKILESQDAEVSKIDFTLRDIHNKKVTLSELRGKIVLINFWATWCPPCREEMPNLDAIYTHYQSQGLVVLSISSEDANTVYKFLAPTTYHPEVLIDSGGKVSKQFHVDGIPRTYIFGRDGKLVAEAMDMRTQHQFLEMLSKTDLHN